MDHPELELIALNGADEIGRWLLTPGVFTVGRAASCSIPLVADGVQDEHARLSVDERGQVQLETAGVGVSVDGNTISGPVRVFPDQYIGLGSVTLLLQARSSAAEHVSLPDDDGGALPPEFRAAARYEVGSQIAKGGMGAVLNARQGTIRRSVAMKVILGAAEDDPRQRLRFIEEAQITGQLEHPNIVPVHDAGLDAEGRVFYTMKLVKGITLKKVLELLRQGEAGAFRKYPLPALLTIYQKVCDAVAFAHARGVIHRDLKPENIMIGSYGEVLVMDWGLAKLIRQRAPAQVGGPPPAPVLADDSVVSARFDEGEAHATVEGSVMGTPAYMAPEQARGELNRLDPRTDIFALGVILYEILTLTRPFTAATGQALLARITSGEPPASPAQANRRKADAALKLAHLPAGQVPDSLSAVAMKALAFAPESRYQQVKALQDELTAYQNGFATTAEKAGTWKQVKLLVARHRGIAATMAASLVLIVALTAAYLIRVLASERLAVASERRAVANERNALESLTRLQATAPTFAAQAQALIDNQKFPEALDKIGVAIELNPKVADYWVIKGNLLESLFRLPEARTAYARALERQPDHSMARENYDVCVQVLKAQGDREDLTKASISALNSIMRKEGRAAEGIATLRVLNQDRRVLFETWSEAIRKAGIHTSQDSLVLREDGFFELSLLNNPLDNLNPLKGMPIAVLRISGAKVSDLSPLRELPIRTLDLSHTRVRDLAPLQGLPLRTLDLSNTDITDLSPLRGDPIHELVLRRTSVRDIAALAGMPLEKLDLYGAIKETLDLTPLRGMPLRELDLTGRVVANVDALRGLPLEALVLPINIDDLAFIRGMPLRQLAFSGRAIVPTLEPIRGMRLERLLLGTAAGSDVSLVRGMPLEEIGLSGSTCTDLSPLEDMHLHKVDLRASAVKEISKLKGQPIQIALLDKTAITDFSVIADWPLNVQLSAADTAFGDKDLKALAGKKIETLNLKGTKIRDLSLLKGMIIRNLELSDTNVTDLTPLRDILGLVFVRVPPNSNVEKLRAMESLQRIAVEADGFGLPVTTFWKEYDARKANGR